MATAVENADIIVVCISQNYFDSKNCKKELEYADELGTGFIRTVKIDDKRCMGTVRRTLMKEKLWLLSSLILIFG